MVTSRASRAWCLGIAIVAATPLLAEQSDTGSRRDTLPAAFIGRVTDSAGVGLPGAEISLFKSDRVSAITDDSGGFRLTGLAPGTSVFNVRRLGFEPASFTAVLKSGKTQRATLRLTATALALPGMAVADTALKSHWLDQFEHRKGTSRGTFITRKDIERRGARTGTDIVRMVPGLRLATLRNGTNQVIMTRGAGARICLPTMFVHGMPYSGTLDDFAADDVEALEVYVGISEVPPELDKNGRGICGAIVVWTRDPRKPPV